MAHKPNKDTLYKAAKPSTKDRMINDGGGLYLLIKPSGAKWWQFVYTFENKRKKFSLGVYPDVTLEAARRKAEQARDNIANGVDPSEIRNEARKAKQLAKLNDGRVNDGLPILNSFADVARQWLDSIAHLTSATTHIKKTSRIERLAFLTLGDISTLGSVIF
jgi:hypothetical protein